MRPISSQPFRRFAVIQLLVVFRPYLLTHTMRVQPISCLLHQMIWCAGYMADAFVNTSPEDNVFFRHLCTLLTEICFYSFSVKGKQCLIAFLDKTCNPCSHTLILPAPEGAYTSILSHLRLLKLLTITTRHRSHSSLMVPWAFLQPVTKAPQLGQCHENGTHSSCFVISYCTPLLHSVRHKLSAHVMQQSKCFNHMLRYALYDKFSNTNYLAWISRLILILEKRIP